MACKYVKNPPEDLGGIVYKTDQFQVEHCAARFGEGAFIVKTKRHVEFVDEFTDKEQEEFGKVISKITNGIRKTLEDVERVYCTFWGEETKHVHFVLQPRFTGQIEQYGGKRGPRLQGEMAEDYHAGKEVNKVKAKEIALKLKEFLEGAVG